jgi:hypothetical protein
MYYEISNLGNMRNSRNKYILKPQKNHKGYFMVSTTMGSKKNIKGIMIHIAVAESFIDNPENKLTVNHMDGDKENNKLYNLEWATQKEQSEHAIKMGLINNSGENNPNSKCNKEDVFNILNDRMKGLSYIKLCKKYNLSKPSIMNICKGISYKEYFKEYNNLYEYSNNTKKERISYDVVEYIRNNYIPFDEYYSAPALSKKLNISLGTVKNIIYCNIYK